MLEARTIALALVCCVWPIAQMMKPGRFSASVLAMYSMSSAGVPVTLGHLARGVHFAITSFFTLSMP